MTAFVVMVLKGLTTDMHIVVEALLSGGQILVTVPPRPVVRNVKHSEKLVTI
ncbi:MAG: hypothetical protein J7J38_01970 [Candidatus Aenigmarchaeota archaeon]|nr:hypothetical protein [Candidatus Aenigmarchaeota archaeon]